MKKIARLLMYAFLCAILTALCACASTLDFEVESAKEAVLMTDTDRVSVSVMDDWKFLFGATDAEKTDTDDSAWSSVTLPHTWNASDGSDGGNNYAKGEGWYRKQLQVPASFEGSRIYLVFEGVNSECTLYIDGVLVPYVFEDGTQSDIHRGGYTTFRYDITDYVTPGSTHLVAVCADNTINKEIAPIAGDWTFHGGIYREVWLVSVPEVHIDMLNYGSDSVFVTPKKNSDDSWTVEVKTVIANDGEAEKTVTVSTVMREPESFEACQYIPESLTPFDEDSMYGTSIIDSASESVTVPAGSKVTYTKTFTVTSPRLWNGIEDPYRYQFDVAVTDGEFTDKVTEFAGFRTFYVDANEGFFLNGSHLALRGVSRHQDRQGLGWAITEDDHDLDISLIYELGANSIRLAHYPHDKYFYELCDKYGLVIWAEVPFVTDIGGTGEYGEFDEVREKHVQNVKDQLIEMIRQQYNRPSIMFWGLQNELRPDYDEILQTLIPELHDIAKAEDPSRLTTFASYHDTAYNWKADVMAWNYYPGWYVGETEAMTTYFDKYHELYPDVAIGISEYGAGGSVKTHTDADPITDAKPEPFGDHTHPEEYQTHVHAELARQLQSGDLDYLWATYIWCMFDFASDSRNEGDRNGINDKGIVTYDRQTKKDSFYVYKAVWSDDPFVHIEESRFTTRELEHIPVRITSNCETVSITVNGEPFGSAITNDGYGRFIFEDVPLEIGENTVTATAVAENGETFTESVTWTRKISSQTVISSSVLTVDNDKKTVVLRTSINAEDIYDYIFSRFNATYTVIAKDGETAVSSGVIEPRMFLRVTAEDGETYEDYMFVANNIAFGKTVYCGSEALPNFTNGVTVEAHWTYCPNYPDLTFTEATLDLDLEDIYHLNHVVLHVPYNNYGYKVYVSTDGEGYTLACDASSTRKGGMVELPLGDVMGRYVKIVFAEGTYSPTCTEVEVQGWKFSSSVYEIDEENSLIITNTSGETVDTQTFLLNCAIDGNCIYSINSGAYYISDGDVLTVNGQTTGVSKYTVCTGNGCTAKHLTDVALNRPIINDPGCESGLYPKYINDGDISTRWGANGATFPIHLIIDLERYCNIEYFDLTMFAYEYGNNRAYLYEILVSNDNQTWTQVVDNTNNNNFSGLYTHHLDAPMVARYVKINFTGRKIYTTNAGSAGMYNFSVYGTAYDGTPAGIEFVTPSIYLGVGNMERSGVSAIPSFANLPDDLVYASSDESVAIIDNSGIITAIAEGSCNISVYSESTGFSSEAVVTVNKLKNLSVNRTLHSASDTNGQSAGHYPKNIIDGHSMVVDDVDGRWHCSSTEYPQYAIIDLERLCNIEEIKVDMFGSQYPGNRYYGYKLYAGETVDDMTLIADNSANTDKLGVYTHTLEEEFLARYVKILVTGCSISSGAGVNEISVFGQDLFVPLLDYEITTSETVIGELTEISGTAVPSDAYTLGLSVKSSDETVIKIVDNKLVGLAFGSADISVYNTEGILLDTKSVLVVPERIVSIGKPIVDYDDFGVELEFGTNYKNTADKLTDGLRPANNASDFNFERWHLTDRETHYAVVDLETIHDINGFKSYFFYWNSRAYGYRISVSTNGTDFTTVVDKLTNTTKGICSDTLDGYIKARYVKLELTAPTSGGSASSTPGCYEFEIYGREALPEYKPYTIACQEIRLGSKIGVRTKASVPSSYRNLDNGVEYGFIVARTDMLENASIDATELSFDVTAIPTVSGISYKKDENGDVITDVINATTDDGSVVFSAVLTGITEENYDVSLTVRPYLKTVSVLGNNVTFYGTPKEMSLYDTAIAIKEAGYPGLSEENIAEIDAIISVVEA